jgi:acyl-coenzyme A synthetase/AMP-(fatty) acid ligase/ankyrin repeat protein
MRLVCCALVAVMKEASGHSGVAPSDRACLVWRRLREGDAHCSKSYWDAAPFGGLVKPQGDGLGAVTRAAFDALSSRLVDALRDRIRDSLDETMAGETTTTDLLSVPVAIAIPEGVYLPLAVAVVHALNGPFFASDSLVSAVLVPLEPSEGQNRLVHMLNSTRPLFILTASTQDAERLREVLARIESAEASLIQQGVLLSRACHVIDWRTLVKQAADGIDEAALDYTSKQSTIDRPDTDNYTATATSALAQPLDASPVNRLSHIVFTSGTTGVPKGCKSSAQALQTYISAKNKAHEITAASTVLLASALSFDPCFSDVLATLQEGAILALARRQDLRENLYNLLTDLQVSHVLCTPTLWSTLGSSKPLPSLRVLALGGEPIPPFITRTWTVNEQFKLMATFGVTEACVYQTAGVVDYTLPRVGQWVGRPFQGTLVRICQENIQNDLVGIDATGYPEGLGEIVLLGDQLDEYSGYFGQEDLTANKFLVDKTTNRVSYRTGDRGYFDSDNNLCVLGRINAEDSMVKFNGVRIELGEIENALIDCTDEVSVVTDAVCAAVVNQDAMSESSLAQAIYAYIVLSQQCLSEIGVAIAIPDTGAICDLSVLVTLLQERCRLGSRVLPSAFVIIPRVPTAPTGKRSRKEVQSIDQAVPLTSLINGSDAIIKSVPLQDHGRAGRVLGPIITECLNLQPSQLPLLTASANFAMLGGDSLAATRVVRALYAHHHNVHNTRHLGGEYGMLQGNFSVARFISSPSLGLYVDWLDQHNICQPNETIKQVLAHEMAETDNNQPVHNGSTDNTVMSDGPQTDKMSLLYDSLLQAISQRYSVIAQGLLDAGADPNHGAHGKRRGKIKSGRLARRNAFFTSPLHMACLSTQPLVVKHLLNKGAHFNTPDASELFPLHLAAGSTSASTGSTNTNSNGVDDESIDQRRLECVKLILQAGAPVTMKDGNKQSFIHSAARSGSCAVLQYALLPEMEGAVDTDCNVLYTLDRAAIKQMLDWRDRWMRTPVHWAVLNGHVQALEILLQAGASPDPPAPHSNRQSSAAIESPMDICLRVHGETDKGRRMRDLLQGGY